MMYGRSLAPDGAGWGAVKGAAHPEGRRGWSQAVVEQGGTGAVEALALTFKDYFHAFF